MFPCSINLGLAAPAEEPNTVLNLGPEAPIYINICTYIYIYIWAYIGLGLGLRV